jgi:3-hydroxyacyl-[acyl-carrier-protein] dehydratase
VAFFFTENGVLKMDINEIKKYIPHRYPFLLVDRVMSYDANVTIHAIKNVTVNEPFFNGHFPARPVMPGVLMLEALAQAAGLLIAKSLDWPKDHGNVFFLAGVDKVRYKRVVEPGDQLDLNANVLRMRRDLWKFDCKASVDGQVACISEIMIIRGQ